MKRKYSPLHDKWHRRVEGQINDCINAHGWWFSFENDRDKADCVNSLAKRIVGEIVEEFRGCLLNGAKDGENACSVVSPFESGGAGLVLSDNADVLYGASASNTDKEEWNGNAI